MLKGTYTLLITPFKDDFSLDEEGLRTLVKLQLKAGVHGIAPLGVTGENISIGSTYVPLDRLVRKGLLETWQSDPLPERGGMSRRYYKITKEGVAALKQARQVQDTLWDGLPKPSFSKGRSK